MRILIFALVLFAATAPLYAQGPITHNPIYQALRIQLNECEVELAALRAQESSLIEELRQLQQRYTPAHPEVAALADTVASIRERISRTAARRTELQRQIAREQPTLDWWR